MEVIELPGYTRQEKLHIAMKYLLARQIKENGLKAPQARWTEQAICRIIDQYTREAGVRELERQIGTVCRRIASLVAAGKVRARKVAPAFVAEVLGPPKYDSELALRTSVPGVATGLAYTPTGGEIIFVEVAAYPGKGALSLTGQIGDVMRESAQAAFSLLKSRAGKLHLDLDALAKLDIHIHVPAGGVPKDGPSAGVAIFTALTSLLTGKPIQTEVAMTGEITLRGLVLPVGGVKEKVLAAKRAGIRTVVLPERNRKDIVDVPQDARKELHFAFVKDVDQVLKVALGDGRVGGNRTRRGRSRRSAGRGN
jgi:ATP-dependent Lon protease